MAGNNDEPCGGTDTACNILQGGKFFGAFRSTTNIAKFPLRICMVC